MDHNSPISTIDSNYLVGLKLIAQTIAEKLDTSCVDGRYILRRELCESLGLGEEHEPLISILFKENLLTGYQLKPGSGIVRIDQPKPTRANNPNRLNQSFLKDLETALEQAIPLGSDQGVSRAVVAGHLGQPGAKMENKISEAFSSGHFVGKYRSKKGPGGGIFRITESTTTNEPNNIMTMETSDSD